jgi:ABC-type nitrate/sulfonate/bicarbonate transport system substrate-binding protein
MSANPQVLPDSQSALQRIWFTRCPVPTASGLAHRLGWLSEEFARDGISVATLQEGPQELAGRHYDHDLPGLFREGGNVPALAARAQGIPTRLIGLTWIDESQSILVRADSPIRRPEDLKGARIALPAFGATRGQSFVRAMTLQGVRGALALAGLPFEAITFVEVPLSRSVGDGRERLQRLWAGLTQLVEGEVDAVYVKGAAAVDAARRLGLTVGIDLDGFPDKRTRVNNGTPRPITVHEDLLRDHFDVVVRFLAQTLRAANWARDNRDELLRILEGETRAGAEGVASAYRGEFHRSLDPTLDPERLALLRQQKDFLWRHGFLEHDIDIDAWADPRPLAAAHELLSRR